MPLPDPWPAPYAPAGVTGTVSVPGSKSVTNRALLLGLLATGPSVIRRPLRARDTVLMVDAVRALGADVTGTRDDWHVRPHPGPLRGGVAVDCGLAGTVMRFVPVVAALAARPVTVDGDPRARDRPMGQVVESLRALGVRVQDAGRGRLPFTVSGTGRVRGGALEVDASASSQFLSALLLAAPRFEEGLAVTHTGPRLPSRRHVAMTVAMLVERGVRVRAHPEANRWEVEPGPIAGVDTVVEPDLSTAAPFLAAAAVAGGQVTVSGWPPRTDQPGGHLLDLLARMGARVHTGPEGATVTGDGPGTLTGVDLDLGDAPELVPVLTAVAAVARTPSTIRGVAHVRGQESDRLAVLAAEITALGGSVTETADGLAVRPRPLHQQDGRPFRTHADHRIAHAGALLGLVVPGLRIADIATTAKTFPAFPTAWSAMPTAPAPVAV